MKIILFIDTTSNEQIKINLFMDNYASIGEFKLEKQKAQIVLPMVRKLLNEKKLNLKDITEIKVNPGPGSFTGIRVGITIANTLAFLLKIPINGLPVGELVEPRYS